MMLRPVDLRPGDVLADGTLVTGPWLPRRSRERTTWIVETDRGWREWTDARWPCVEVARRAA